MVRRSLRSVKWGGADADGRGGGYGKARPRGPGFRNEERATGLEPVTYSLEGYRSSQLSYARTQGETSRWPARGSTPAAAGADRVQPAAGTWKEKVLPRPSLLRTWMVPPCRSTMVRAMARPSPSPGCGRSAVRQKGSKMCSR
jgi:hypothetical protein